MPELEPKIESEDKSVKTDETKAAKDNPDESIKTKDAKALPEVFSIGGIKDVVGAPKPTPDNSTKKAKKDKDKDKEKDNEKEDGFEMLRIAWGAYESSKGIHEDLYGKAKN